MQKKEHSYVILAAFLVVAAALSRLALYPHNFSPIIAMALFSGAVIKDRKLAFALPVLSMFVSDALFELFNIADGFWGWGQLVVYGLLAGITAIGFLIKKISVLNVASFSVLSSLIFFFFSNASVWVFQPGVYASDISGLRDSLIAGLPFLKNGIVADLVYCGVLFGSYQLLLKGKMQRATVR